MSTSPPKAEWLEAFIAFAEHRNFTRAARALHLSQPALYAQVHKLASALGVPLYRRQGRLLELTADGERALAFARESRERTLAFVEALRGGGPPRPLVLSAGEGSYLYLLGGALRAFLRSRAAPLRLLTHDREGTLRALARGEAHLGVSTLDALPDDLTAETLAEVGPAVVLPPRHPLAHRRSLSLADLEGASLVVPPVGRPHRENLEGALRAAGVSWRVAVEANGWELMIHFVRLGFGAAVVNGFCRAPAPLLRKPLRGLAGVRYAVLHRREGPRHAAAPQLKALLLAHGDDWRRGLDPPAGSKGG
ncbi:MAG: LysR substrate-binding domain-containing protein [Polyangiaceae bacterium]|jgi:LysR family transcriptional regulator, low CO2-responsive transcriptional regulator|nr:LysR substrate-binding domain-containing protein [Polyangiaceae bacterium]